MMHGDGEFRDPGSELTPATAILSAKKSAQDHIQRVRELLIDFMARLAVRGTRHDASKFADIEILPLARMQAIIDRDGPAEFGSDEYKRRTAMLGPMLDHHYANNSHHPEHYGNGVDGMDLLDLVEMFLDWKAASERGKESAMNLTHACERYNVSPQLASILRNTADRFGFNHK